MRVRMMATAASPAGVLLAGEVWDLAETQAVALVAGGYAAALEIAPSDGCEATSVDPRVETAALPQGRKRRPGPGS